MTTYWSTYRLKVGINILPFPYKMLGMKSYIYHGTGSLTISQELSKYKLIIYCSTSSDIEIEWLKKLNLIDNILF